MMWKPFFAAACAAALAATPALAQDSTGGGIAPTIPGRAISVNFTNEANKIPEGTVYGIDQAQVAGWNNVTPVQLEGGGYAATVDKGTVEVTGSDGTSAAKLAFVANNVWSYSQSNVPTDGVDPLLCYYLGDNTNTTNAPEGQVITVSEIPFETYDVIVYLSTDTASTSFLPVTVNKIKYVGTAAGAKEVLSDTATWGTSQPKTSSLGGNVLRVAGVTGASLTIKGSVQKDVDGAKRRCNIAGFQIVEVFPSISVNFAGDASGTHSVQISDPSKSYGLFPVPGSEWKNGFTGSGAIQVSSAYGSSETFSSTLFYKSKNIYYDMDNDTLLKTYLDDGIDPDNDITGASISMDNVPFTEYAVIVYFATDKGSAFFPVTVNGETYTWDSETGATVEGSTNFGNPSVTTPTLGQNALCVTGLSDNLTIEGGESSTGQGVRGGIAAIQIICTGKVDAFLAPAPEAETSVISLNFGADNNRQVPQTADTYGLIPVPGYTWTNISRASDSQPVTVASGKPLTKEPTVDYDSDLTHFYDQATDPFLKGYLDDGQRSEGVGASVTVSNLPFRAYDVVVYAGLGDDSSVARPVRVNGTLYTWDSVRGATIATDDETAAYGRIQPTAQYGRNALRVKGLSDYEYKLTIQGLPRSGSQRGGIAAIQIVERKVIQNDNIGDLDPSSDTPVHILLTKQISGDLTLPPDAILDLSTYWLYGATPPITGTLTVNEGTQIRLPKGASWTIAGTMIEGADSLADNAVIVDGSLATGVEVSGGTISADATYVWTGGFGNLWSNPYNWSSHTVPNAEADVTIPLAANGAVTIELPSDTGAVAKSVTITGPESGSATLALTSAEGETGSLTVSGQMLTTGNVTVTQSANITVQGASTMGDGSPIPQNQVVQAGFHIHQGTWQIRSGTLSMPTEGGTNIGEAGISGNGKLIVGGEGASEATLAVRQIRTVYYNKDTGLANGTLSVATGGTLKASSSVQLPGQTYTTELAGGTIETPTLITFAGATVSADSFLRAPTGGATVRTQGGTNDALTGTGGVTLSGTVTIESALTGYDGTLTVSSGAALTLSDDARPSLVLVSGATEAKTSLTVTPTDGEAGSGTIVFPTTMTTEPENVTYTVSGVTKAITVTVNDNEDTLTLSWKADYPTLSTTSNWSTTANWTNLPAGTTYPTSGSVTLDGTQEAITVTLDTDLSEMTSIFVKGNVTLVTKGTQSTTIPACVALTTDATLTVDANFSGAWELPDGTTLQVSEGFTSFANLTLEGAVVILSEASGTDASPTKIAATGVEFNGGLTIVASNLTLKSMYNVGTTLALAGSNITIEGNSFFTDNDTKVVNTDSDNVITGMTGLNGSLAVQGGTLALTLGAKPNKNYFSGATIAADATLTLAAVPDSSTGVTTAQGWFFPVTGDGTLEIEVGDYDFRPNFSTLPKNMVFTATAEEQAAGVIECKAESGLTLPAGFTVTVHPADDGGAWAPNPVLDLEAGYLRIYNQLPTNLPAGVADAVAQTIQEAAKTAGITNKGYAIRLTTGGQTVDVTAAALNDVLGCFTDLEATAEGTTLTYAYNFGISGVRRTAEGGWEVVVKVTGAGGAPAGFAADNVYRINGEVVVALEASAQASQGEVVLPVTEKLLKAGVSVSVARP